MEPPVAYELTERIGKAVKFAGVESDKRNQADRHQSYGKHQFKVDRTGSWLLCKFLHPFGDQVFF
jgi:hypothetical protein